MTTGTLQTYRRRRRDVGFAPGFTLLEILVVLVILLIGILAILRLFPGGFLTIKRTGEMQMAEALVTEQLDAQKNLSALAEGFIAAVSGPNNSLIPLKDVQPNDLTDVTNADLATEATLSGGQAVIPQPLQGTGQGPNYYYSNINRIRNVMGEFAHIPVPTSNNNTVFGSIYFLQFGPVFNTFGTDANNLPTDGLNVRGAPLERVVQSSTGSNINGTNDPNGNASSPTTIAELNYPTQYAIDYTNLVIAFAPRIRDGGGSRTFLMSFDYYTAANATSLPTVKSVIDYAITVPDVPVANAANAQPIWQPIFPNNSMQTVAPNLIAFKQDSDVVSRKFQLLYGDNAVTNSSSWSWSGDPYEYVWFSPQVGSFANAGVLLFNPRGYNYLEQTSSGTQPLSVRVDYTILDNHILREDRTVPTATPYSVKLALPFVLTNGDILPDQTTYNGMFQEQNATPDLILYDENNGLEIGEFQNGTYTNKTAFTGLNASLDNKTGLIRFLFDPTTTDGQTLQKTLPNTTLRIFYRAQGEWGMQVQKAQATYKQAGDPGSVSYNSYYLGGTQANVGQPTRMYFPLNEAGKTVVLGQYYVSTNQAAPNDVRQFSNEAYRINDNPALYETLNGVRLTWIDLVSQHPEAAATGQNWQWNSGYNGLAVSSVQGGSVKSRVIWRDADHWRKVDNDTILPQGQ